ncbi:RagB/SusD family nutrient uptake outer membrane protein [uncultured Bacteroides sp.]|uniref:RagB/SusD family nutrient uptake outer membrane protein n=1 Tax=uncultured Bacteroides sp. TaxID=162156 RepID=UPI0025E8DA14|nr:RagB/SusD family nutrient uptake outer membrane protein [uncultured Bacteroides sp.]
MKKIFYYILVSAMCILPFSCSLDEESRTEIDKTRFMMNAQEAETVLLGVYQSLVSDAMYGYNLSILFNLATDCEQVEGNTTENYRIIPSNAFNSSQAEVQATWAGLYKAIYNANDFIEIIQQRMKIYTETDRQLAYLYIAEARAIRGMCYFELVRRFGNVPLMTSTAMSEQAPSTFVQERPEVVYQFIEKDLVHAAQTLPYATDDTERTNNKFRISKGAALGLLTKVYATWAGYPVKDESKWEEAAKTAKVLVESKKHSLLNDYEQLWINTCNGAWDPTESLIEISFYSPTASGGASDPCGRIGKWNGVKTTVIAGERGSCAGNVKVIHPFVLKWRTKDLVEGEEYNEETVKDKRLNLSVANYQYNPTKTLYAKGKSDTEAKAIENDRKPEMKNKEKQNYTPAKWDIEKYVQNKLINNDKSNVNWYFLRYSDVLLLYAEALNEWKGSPTPEAYAAINEVRRRAYGNNDHDLKGLSPEEFRQAVQDERAYELAFEGHRRMDLVRWGIYYKTVKTTSNAINLWFQDNDPEKNKPYNTAGRYTKLGKHELYPIPQRDMDLCEQFNQNPNWEQ